MVMAVRPLSFSSFVFSRDSLAQDAQNGHSIGYGVCQGLELVVSFHRMLSWLLPTAYSKSKECENVYQLVAYIIKGRMYINCSAYIINDGKLEKAS